MIHKIVIPTPFAVGDVNAFVVKGDCLSLVDAGPKTPDAYEALKTGLKEIGYTFNDIEQVFLTHHHPDHAGWMDAFDKAEVIGHPYTDLWLKRDEEFMAFHDRFYLERLHEEGVPEEYFSWIEKMKRPIKLMGDRTLDRETNEGDDWLGHPGWKVLETLGHAQSHLALFNERTGEMIGGDLVLEKVSSNPLIEPPFNPSDERPKSLLQYNDSLKRLLDMPIDMIYSGHGNEVKNIHSLIESRLQKQHERAMKVHGMLAGRSKTIYEVTAELFPAVYLKELGLTLSETIGQTDYLLSKGLIKQTADESGILKYEQQ
ncbi:MBL fold metallo-hydrolase [Sporosarcina oncorhynchi]|uniref:MBL fold metallo-hydrolase n=1 Tax=Sporosarcina oncorhynchi TaxID=3056444 RepID=A0ABZ0L8U0_9BACL|nr:MBL fold metallo-hydrolase [Sporosarcina sp. T2O-4]WOV88920.1 MBL fold metallo-hydrolase [Sporosarcina sp. T2O-4]